MRKLIMDLFPTDQTIAIWVVGGLLILSLVVLVRKSLTTRQYLIAALISVGAVVTCKVYLGTNILSLDNTWLTLHLLAVAYAAATCWCSRTGGGMSGGETSTLFILGLLAVLGVGMFYQSTLKAGLALFVVFAILVPYYLKYGYEVVSDGYANRKSDVPVQKLAFLGAALLLGGALLYYYAGGGVSESIGWVAEKTTTILGGAAEGAAGAATEAAARKQTKTGQGGSKTADTSDSPTTTSTAQIGVQREATPAEYAQLRGCYKYSENKGEATLHILNTKNELVQSSMKPAKIIGWGAKARANMGWSLPFILFGETDKKKEFPIIFNLASCGKTSAKEDNSF